VMASEPHSLILMWGWRQTSKRWLVKGLQYISTRSRFTSPISNSLATANRDGSYEMNQREVRWKLVPNFRSIGQNIMSILVVSGQNCMYMVNISC
jgi:hypothetical protein